MCGRAPRADIRECVDGRRGGGEDEWVRSGWAPLFSALDRTEGDEERVGNGCGPIWSSITHIYRVGQSAMVHG